MVGEEVVSCGSRVCQLAESSASFVIVAPFIKERALERIIDVLGSDVDLRVYSRWHAHEVSAGVSDLACLDVVERVGGQMFLEPNLHAKAFVGDEKCLVGSANVTLTGLGWSSKSAIELLVPTSRDQAAVVRLLSGLKARSSLATAVVRDEVARLASQIDSSDKWRDDIEDEGESDGQEISGIPEFNVPESVWPAYRGNRAREIVRLVRRDLDALGIPGGIEDKEEFDAIVAAALTQGLTGRLIQECSDVNAVDAADRFREVLEEVGVSTPVGELGAKYQTFVRWVSHFVSGRTLRATGFSLR